MINLQEIESEIKDILNGYMKIPSFSQSKDEKEAVDYVIKILKKNPILSRIQISWGAIGFSGIHWKGR